MILNNIICRYSDDENDSSNSTCWDKIEDVDSMDIDDGIAIFQEYM